MADEELDDIQLRDAIAKTKEQLRNALAVLVEVAEDAAGGARANSAFLRSRKRPSAQDDDAALYGSLSYAEMASIVRGFRAEAERRNTPGIIFASSILDDAADTLEMLGRQKG